jgi:sarcosine oxidase
MGVRHGVVGGLVWVTVPGMRIAVVGAGITGLAVTYELLRGGHDVWCFEAGTPMAGRSTGDTRIFRLAHTSAALVDWVAQARREWVGWSVAAGRPLVGAERTVVSGEIADWTSAMVAAGAEHTVTDQAPDLPADAPEGPFLVDPHGGVIQAAQTGRFLLGQVGSALVLETVIAIEPDSEVARVATPSGTQSFDSVVILAGAGTAELAASVGIDAFPEKAHHARFTYWLREHGAVPPCWIDRSGVWRRGFSSYQHLAGHGLWAVGGLIPVEQARWELGHHVVINHSRQIVTQYVTEHVTGAEIEPIETVYCSYPPGLGDGVSTRRAGPVIAAWGDNLFKFAPVLAVALAAAAANASDLSELAAVRPAS